MKRVASTKQASTAAPTVTVGRQPLLTTPERREVVFGYIDPSGTFTIVGADQGTLSPIMGMLFPSGGLTDETFDELFDAKPGAEVRIFSSTGLSSKLVRKMTDGEFSTYAEIHQLSIVR